MDQIIKETLVLIVIRLIKKYQIEQIFKIYNKSLILYKAGLITAGFIPSCAFIIRLNLPFSFMLFMY